MFKRILNIFNKELNLNDKINYLIKNKDRIIYNSNYIMNSKVNLISSNVIEHKSYLQYIINEDKTKRMKINLVSEEYVKEKYIVDWLTDEDGYIVSIKQIIDDLLNTYIEITTWHEVAKDNFENALENINSNKIHPYIIEVETIVNVFYNVVQKMDK